MGDFYLESKTCCFTGHRKIEVSQWKLKKIVKATVIDAVEQGFTHFITGGALGFDTLVAEVVCKLKKTFALTLEIAIPYAEHCKFWSKQEKKKFDRTAKYADKVTTVCSQYSLGCFQVRNEYMVDKSLLVIAYFDGSLGGTKNTIDYAKASNKYVVNIAQKFLNKKQMYINERWSLFDQQIKEKLQSIPINEKEFEKISQAFEEGRQRIEKETPLQ